MSKQPNPNQAAKPVISTEELEKASAAVDSILKSMSSPAAEQVHSTEQVDETKLAAKPTEHLFDNPKAALMEEEIIQKAAEPLIAMAAFLAEAVDGLNKAFTALADRQEEINKATLQNMQALTKAASANADLIKSFGSQQATEFRTDVPNAEAELKKSAPATDMPNRAFVSQCIEKAVTAGKMTAHDMAVFESTGNVPAALATDIMKAWKDAKGLSAQA